MELAGAEPVDEQFRLGEGALCAVRHGLSQSLDAGEAREVRYRLARWTGGKS